MVDGELGRRPRTPRIDEPSLAGTYRLPAIIGRTAELTELRLLLGDPRVRLLTVTGTAGVGKSAIAREALADSEFRTCLDAATDLAEAGSRAEAWNAVLDAVGHRPLGSACRQPEDPAVALAILAARIGACRAIMLLDNCDRVGADLSADVAALLDRCPHLMILTTSRTPLHLYRECVLCVRPLSTDSGGDYLPGSSPAAQLLLECVDSHYRSAAALADRMVLDEIARELDGVPLALELAASTIARIGPARTLYRVKSGADLQPPPFVDLPTRHRTLHGAVEWSLDDLDPTVRDLLLRLSLLESSIDLETACLVSPVDEDRTTAGIAELVQRSLLEHAAGGTGRHEYRFVATVRAYCRRVLDRDALRAGALRSDHVDRIERLAETLGRRCNHSESRTAALEFAGRRIADFLGAVRALTAAGELERAVRVAARLDCVWTQYGCQSDLESMLGTVLTEGDRGPLDPGGAAPLCLEVLGSWALGSGRPRRAIDLLATAMAAHQRFGDTAGACRAAVALAAAMMAVGDRAGAARHFAAAAAHRARLGERSDRWFVLCSAVLELPESPRHAQQAWPEIRARMRAFDITERLCVLNVLARSQIGPDTADRAQVLLREVLEFGDPGGHILQTIVALEECSLVYEVAGPAYLEHAAMLALAGRHLRRVYRLAPTEPGDIGRPDEEYRDALGEGRFRDLAATAAELSLSDAVSYARAAPAVRGPAASPLAALTTRQREIARLIATGMTNRKIATQLRISEWTVVNHVRQVMIKLDCPSRLHVALLVERDTHPRGEANGPGSSTEELPSIAVAHDG